MHACSAIGANNRFINCSQYIHRSLMYTRLRLDKLPFKRKPDRRERGVAKQLLPDFIVGACRQFVTADASQGKD